MSKAAPPPMGLCATYLSDVARQIRVVGDGTPFPLEIEPGGHPDFQFFVGARLGAVRLVSSRQPCTSIPFSWALRRAAWSLYCDALVAITSEAPKACRFVLQRNGFELLVPQLIMLRKTGLSETDQGTTQQGVGRIPACHPLSRAPVYSNSVKGTGI